MAFHKVGKTREVEIKNVSEPQMNVYTVCM